MNRATTSQSLERTRAMLDRCLRSGQSTSLAAEYPLIFDARFSGRVASVEIDGDVRSACAWLVRDLLIDGAKLRVGLIGSVATHGDWRGRGLASRVLLDAESKLAREGCALAILWADTPDFYTARGYAQIGWEADFVAPLELLARAETTAGVRALAADDVAAVHRLYSLHHARVDRSQLETAALLHCPGMSTMVLQRERDIVAYACLGRGADFANTVHEWGGAAADVIALMGEHARRAQRDGCSGSLALIAPPGAFAMREGMRALGAQASEGVLAMAKVLDSESLCELLDRFGSGLRTQRDSDARQTTRVIVHGPKGELALSESELLAALFAPRGDRAAIARIERASGCSAPQLPLAPFLWGLDSI